MSRLARAVATVLGLGDRLPAPGTTAGSLPAAVAWAGAALATARPDLLVGGTLLAAAATAAVGVWAAGRVARERGAEDPGAVVVDEVAGQWLTLALAAWWAPAWGPLPLAAAGFVAFRVFDVLKPWPVRTLERLPGGVGIMADDLAAAVYAGITVLVAARLL